MHRQSTPYPQQRQNPVRRTFSRSLFVYLRNGRNSQRAPKKGALPLVPLLFRPRWEEEGVVEACCCDREITGETPPRSAVEPTRIPPWTVQPNISEESSGDVTSAEQEHRSKPHASWSGQNPAKELEKYQTTREGQHITSVRPLQPGP